MIPDFALNRKKAPASLKSWPRQLSPADRLQVPLCLAKSHSGSFLFNRIRLAPELFSYLGGGIGREKFSEQADFGFCPEAFRGFFPLCGFFLCRFPLYDLFLLRNFSLLSHFMLPFAK